jgi:RimJ/RimL family protein N-acetyltransferase
VLGKSCRYETSRLLVGEWHRASAGDSGRYDLAEVVAGMLTESVTQSLPPGWQGSYDRHRAQSWIEDRDLEGTTLLVVSKSTALPIGIVILSESAREDDAKVDFRIGYLLSESSWGQGLASELLQGLVDWCRQSPVNSVIGGVERRNVASQRVLEKSGFFCDQASADSDVGELMYELRFEP